MAKQGNGYLGGYSGRLGPAVGYLWNGKWCLRSLPRQVRNPRSDKQMTSRALFSQEVQLASRFSRAVNLGLTAAARAEGMTAYNLFVRLNQQAFSLDEGTLQVDYTQLTLSVGPVAPVGFESLSSEAGNVLRVTFVKNPLHLRSNHFDAVYLFVFCPENRQGYLTLPVNRRDEEIGVVLPDFFAGREVQVYGFVQDDLGRSSMSQYIGSALVGEDVAEHRQVVVAQQENTEIQGTPETPDLPARRDRFYSKKSQRDVRPAPPPDPPDPNQLSLW